jgi:ABC-type sugar transport system ATPase subunit
VSEPDLLLDATEIRKSFLGLKALDGVDFSVRKGEIHALLGENGAGKSTLIKVLTGVHKADSGAIELNGEAVAVRDPMHAQQLGIGTVYQEVNLLPNLTVAENLYIGRQPRRFGLVDTRTMQKQAKSLLAQYDIDIDVVLGEQRLGLLLHRTGVDEPESSRLAADIEILRHRQVRQEIHLLVDGADAQLLGVHGVAHRHGFAVKFDGPAVGLVDAGQHLDQRRLAGAVLAEQGMDFALAHREVDTVKSFQAEKALADFGRVEQQVRLAHGVLPRG